MRSLIRSSVRIGCAGTFYNNFIMPALSWPILVLRLAALYLFPKSTNKLSPAVGFMMRMKKLLPLVVVAQRPGSPTTTTTTTTATVLHLNVVVVVVVTHPPSPFSKKVLYICLWVQGLNFLRRPRFKRRSLASLSHRYKGLTALESWSSQEVQSWLLSQLWDWSDQLFFRE